MICPDSPQTICVNVVLGRSRNNGEFCPEERGCSHPQQITNYERRSERSAAAHDAEHIAAGRDTRAPLHVCDDVIAEFGAFDFGGTFHQAGEIVGDTL